MKNLNEVAAGWRAMRQGCGLHLFVISSEYYQIKTRGFLRWHVSDRQAGRRLIRCSLQYSSNRQKAHEQYIL